MQTRLMVVVAHPDDETFGCGSLLLHAAAHGAETMVVCATRGEAGESDLPDLPAVRERELHAAAALLGVGRVELLGLVDSGMSGPAGPQTLVGADRAGVTGRIRGLLEDFRPDVVVTLDAGDGHRDHAAIREATLAAVASSAVSIPRVYLQCLPQSLMRRWLSHLAESNPGSAYLDTEVPGTPDEQITTVVDTGRHLAVRERAIALHASQVSPYATLPDDLRRAFLTADHLRRVVPPWPGGERERDVFGG